MVGRATSRINQTDHNVMLTIVDWVENRNPPAVIIGTDGQGAERKRCMWPNTKTTWTGKEWACQPALGFFNDAASETRIFGWKDRKLV